MAVRDLFRRKQELPRLVHRAGTLTSRAFRPDRTRLTSYAREDEATKPRLQIRCNALGVIGGDMDRHVVFWWRWLVVAAAIVLAFGLALVLFATPMQAVFEALYYAPRSTSALHSGAVAYTAFMGAVLGATMVGWAVLLLFVLYGPFRQMETTAWNMVAASLVAWFVSDTAISLWFGFWQNAALNTAMLAMFAIPLLATYKLFRQPRTQPVLRPDDPRT